MTEIETIDDLLIDLAMGFYHNNTREMKNKLKLALIEINKMAKKFNKECRGKRLMVFDNATPIQMKNVSLIHPWNKFCNIAIINIQNNKRTNASDFFDKPTQHKMSELLNDILSIMGCIINREG